MHKSPSAKGGRLNGSRHLKSLNTSLVVTKLIKQRLQWPTLQGIHYRISLRKILNKQTAATTMTKMTIATKPGGWWVSESDFQKYQIMLSKMSNFQQNLITHAKKQMYMVHVQEKKQSVVIVPDGACVGI